MTGLRDKIRYFGYEPANYIIKVYPNVVYLSIRPRGHSHCDYLFADRVTRCPENSHSARTPGFLFRSPEFINEFYLTFSQNRVKIGPKFVL